MPANFIFAKHVLDDCFRSAICIFREDFKLAVEIKPIDTLNHEHHDDN
jgi:hypothetical protein